MKQKCKKSRMHKFGENAGFTLVELIVVIAILGILAGVAVPAYSGYIKKANMAADQQLVDAVNTAFAAACIENGINQYDVSYAQIDINADGTIVPTDGSDNYIKGITGITVDTTKINEKFADYYVGNEDSKFSIYKKLECITGVFVGSEGGAMRTVTVGGVEYKISESAIENFKKATAFSENVDELQGRIDGLTGSYTDVVAGLSVGELGVKFGSAYEDYLKKNNINADQMGNATVLYVAQQSAGKTANDAYNQLLTAYQALAQANGGDFSQSVSFDQFAGALGAGNDTLGTTAMLYGAITAYAKGEGKEDAELQNKLTGVQNASSLMSLITYATGPNCNFMNYCSQKDASGNPVAGTASDQFVTDMNGYLGALEGINSASGAFSGDLSNDALWTGQNAESLLSQLLGN